MLRSGHGRVEGWKFMDVDSTQPPASMLLEFTILSFTEDCQQTAASAVTTSSGGSLAAAPHKHSSHLLSLLPPALLKFIAHNSPSEPPR